MAVESELLGPGAAYAKQVEEWLHQAYQAQALQLGFYAFLSQHAGINHFSFNQPINSQSRADTASQSAASNAGQIGGGNVNQSRAGAANQPDVRNLPPQVNQRIYNLPPIWKRIVAELLDIFILFTLKVIITFTAVDFFQLIDLENYDFLNMANPEHINIDNLDYNTALQFTTDLLILEVVHRLVVCIFEAMCTYRGQGGVIGGATPGKLIMGLKIVSCDQVIPVGGTRVLVVPGNNLGIWWALIRSFIKNVSLAIFFPICCSLMFLPNSRTLHDVLSRSIVVENEDRPVRRNP